VVNYKVNKAGLVDIVETLGAEHSREDQQKLDVYANEIYSNIDKSRNCMRNSSEENDEFITVEGSDNTTININRSTRWVIKYRRERFCGNYFFSLYKNNSTRNSCDYG
jgi:hypothetical protein